MIPLHTWVALISALFGGGVALGWVASMNWKRALGLPPEWRSVAYVYGTCVILACFACAQWAAGGTTTGYGALIDLVLIVVICGAWTFGTHWHHHRGDVADTQAAPPPTGGKGSDGP